ncbi:MAG: hypothetical protein SGILL_008806, partial [Bacillariaceae sp.]
LFGSLNRESLGGPAVERIEKYTGRIPNLDRTKTQMKDVLSSAVEKVQPDITSSSVSVGQTNPTKKRKKTRIGETALTSELKTLLQTELTGISVQNEWHVKSKMQNKNGALDLTFFDQSQLEIKTPPGTALSKVKAYGVIEFGVISGSSNLETFFFEKLCQGLTYLELLGDDGLQGPKRSTIGTPPAVPSVEEAMILSVVVLSEMCESGLFATFLVEPRRSKWRVCLLSKNKTDTTEKSSAAFADMISAINALKHFKPPSTWTYLGPNCSRVEIGKKKVVLRAYDTRVRPTHRSPETYLRNGSHRVVDECESLFTYKEGTTPTLNFREQSGHDHRGPYFMVERFFKLEGKLQIIAVPFIDGQPVCKLGARAINLIDELQRLHKEGIVHGDIRGHNTVHNSSHSKFIDFDYSGDAGTVHYPKGYVSKLDDGRRTTIRSTIKKNHDVYALGKLLLRYHEVDVKGLDETEIKKAVAAWSAAYGVMDLEVKKVDKAQDEEKGKEVLENLKTFFAEWRDRRFCATDEWDAPHPVSDGNGT